MSRPLPPRSRFHFWFAMPRCGQGDARGETFLFTHATQQTGAAGLDPSMCAMKDARVADECRYLFLQTSITPPPQGSYFVTLSLRRGQGGQQKRPNLNSGRPHPAAGSFARAPALTTFMVCLAEWRYWKEIVPTSRCNPGSAIAAPRICIIVAAAELPGSASLISRDQSS